MAPPNQTRLRILAGVLRLERFTIADLCAHTGLLSSKVYRVLSDLQDAHILESKSTVVEGEQGPRHCPPKRYQLTADNALRSQLRNELASFLPEYESRPINRHLTKAQELFASLNLDLAGISLKSLNNDELHSWQEITEKRFESLRAELRRARWESDVDFSEAHSDHPLPIAIENSKILEGNCRKQIIEELKRRERKQARVRWGSIFRTALRGAIPMAGAATATGGGSTAFAFQLQNPVSLAEKISFLVRDDIEKLQSTSGASWESLRPFWSSLELDLKEVRTQSDLLAVLAKHAIAYGDTPEQPLAYIQRLLAETGNDNYQLLFNEANLAKLAARHDRARQCWIGYTRFRNLSVEPLNINRPLVARIRSEDWSPTAFEKAAGEISMKCNAAVIAVSETPFDYGNEYVIVPQIYNPAPDKSGRIFISFADALVENRRLYVKTTEAEKPVMLGIPSVVFAELFHNRISDEDAWDLASTVDPKERIVKVDFFRNANTGARSQAEDILKSSLSAELVG
jgi:hypothetical protein